ncbi:hypothetical protein [Gloeocapsopsis dulcis]|uniref:Uncharacterized protein n=1 Tax=Gloeocapsopsis dulcis AAB1 = 1H9 TaxID=1433147 RepID=A0A6N8G338_9CHRO|nr:hypothetical protein [Gloeocapsopsis dulcis]MUL39344.1 hypothetical protein [Gloeocapsopsis dulcis AAB1 = 1H9]WNN89700.1 hypothetical protein P0S91_00965 [Gloeocapsopsis dulcis]
MPTIITEALLRSRRTRIQNTGDPQGIRRINPISGDAPPITSGLGWLAHKLSRFAGFIFGIITRVFPFSISNIFQMLVQAYFAVKMFDWNTADAVLEAQIKANNKLIKDGLAPIIGSTLGYSVMRLANFAIGKTIGKLGKSSSAAAAGITVPVLSARIGLALAEESNEEIRSLVLNYLMNIQRIMVRNSIAAFILTCRRNEWFGMEPITAPLPNASFAQKIEDQIERLPTDWQNFVEELIEGFEDAIIDAGYVVAFEIDDYYRAMKEANKVPGEEEVTTIRINPTVITNG